MRVFVLFTLVSVFCIGCQSGQKEGSGIKGAQKRDVRAILSELNAERLQEALDDGLDPNSPVDKDRPSILLMHFVASGGNPEMIETLFKAGADLNRQDSRNQTPLNLAIGREKPLNAIKLLELGAKSDREGQQRMTPLIAAISSGQNEVAEKLLESGTKVNARINRLSGTALIMAVQLNNVEMVRLLMKHDADPRLKAPNGKDAFGFVKSDEVRKLLEKDNE